MPRFSAGDIVTRLNVDGDPYPHRYEVVRMSSECDCGDCRMYTLTSESGQQLDFPHYDLVLVGSNPVRSEAAELAPMPVIGNIYEVVRGSATGCRILVNTIYNGHTPAVAGPLFDSVGTQIRTVYEVYLEELGGVWRPAPNTLPRELRMPTDRDLRWANAGPNLSDQCMCCTCRDHTHDTQCRWGCSFADPDDCLRLNRVPYNYRGRLTFHGAGPLFLGCELELQTRTHSRNQEAISIVNNHLRDRVIVKGDGSIEEDGIELAMHPMDYDYMVEHFPAQLLFKELKDLGVRPHRSCGMHVHVSRKGFTSGTHSYIWQKFFYRNKIPISALSRRDADRLDRWASFGHHSQRVWAKHFAKGAIGGQRYSAINMCNAETKEVRIFASTLSVQQFYGALGLVDASVEYARELNSSKIIKEKAWDWEAFKSYVSGIDKYNPLKKEIARLGV